ncbi:MAG: NACHT domain-containing protein [Ruminococcus sp.]|nr:NACHT domain-containing protein [Ruminococcus sp.]
MSEKDIAAVAYESGAKKLGEAAADRALNFVIDKVQKKYGEKKIEIGTVFERYLENATERLNQIKTIATGNDPRNIIGENELYIKIGVDFKGNEIDTSRAENLLEHSRNILIIGSDGAGKTMLMRYLFINCALEGKYIPVFVEPVKVNSQKTGEVSILTLIRESITQYDVELPQDEFKYSLRLGKYLFLIDGLDKIRKELALETIVKIQKFCARYPNNKCIVTTRNDDYCNPLETFTYMHSMQLSKEQAIELASKLSKDEKTEEFCRQLDKELYEKHRSFAKNPLLLSMMFLTFMRYLSIPDHLADFFKKAYEALYSSHDNHDKGIYRRDIKCKNLDEEKFRLLFARFCFQTYFDDAYEFEESEFVDLIKNSAVFLELDINPWDYLEDLKNVVCLIVKDGNVYRFAHRSFQAYFAAVYTAERLDDETQKQVLKDLQSEIGPIYNYNSNYKLFLPIHNYRRLFEDYFDLLNQIEHEKFLKNAFENEIRKFMKEACNSDDPDTFILKQCFYGIDIDPYNFTPFYLLTAGEIYTYYCYFMRYYLNKTVSKTVLCKPGVSEICKRIAKGMKDYYINFSSNLDFDSIDNSVNISESEKKELYSNIVEYIEIPLFREKALEWLKKLDDERADLKKKDYRKRL